MKKLKILPPTLREKKRYIMFQVISEEGETIDYSDLEQAIWNTCLDFLGEYGVSKASIWLVKNCWNEKKHVGIIRCNHKSVHDVIASLGLISRLGDTKIIIKIIKVSGTIKTIKKI